MDQLPKPDDPMDDKKTTRRWLSELRNVFLSPDAFQAALQAGDQQVYAVTTYEPATGDGQLHYGYGVLMPGKVGDEYFLTRGHLHAFREAAEVYICLQGTGIMLLEHEQTGECQAKAMTPGEAIYVPGYTAHRTVNTGSEPLVYWGVYPFNAGHDYHTIREKNFQQVVVCLDGKPVVMARSEYVNNVEHKK